MKRTVYLSITRLIDGAYITIRKAQWVLTSSGYRIAGFVTEREAVRIPDFRIS